MACAEMEEKVRKKRGKERERERERERGHARQVEEYNANEGNTERGWVKNRDRKTEGGLDNTRTVLDGRVHERRETSVLFIVGEVILVVRNVT